MKKVLAMVLALAMVFALCACGSGTPAPAAPAATEAPAQEAAPAETEETAEVYNVGVCQLVQHPALDLATEGFIDALTAELGDAVVINNQNASGEIPNCATIIDGFVSDGVDLIMANATPPLAAAASATNTIPVLGTSITNYETAIDNYALGGNISGTSDLAPLDGQANMIVELFPEAKVVGLLYCSAEANSIFQCNAVEGYLVDMGLEVKHYTFNDTNDVAAVTQTACDECDVIYIPTDNTAAANTEAIANVVLPAGKPVICGEEGICAGCGVATLSISYYDIGYATGLMAAQILTGEKSITEMPVEYAPQFTKEYNAANCEALGVEIPADYVAIG